MGSALSIALSYHIVRGRPQKSRYSIKRRDLQSIPELSTLVLSDSDTEDAI